MIAVFIMPITITIIQANTTFHTVSCRVGGGATVQRARHPQNNYFGGRFESNKSVLKDNYVAIQIKDRNSWPIRGESGASPGIACISVVVATKVILEKSL